MVISIQKKLKVKHSFKRMRRWNYTHIIYTNILNKYVSVLYTLRLTTMYIVP